MRKLPRFRVSKWASTWWLDRLSGSMTHKQVVGPWRDRRKAKRAAHRANRANRRTEGLA